MRLVGYERQKRLLSCKWFVAVLCVCLAVPTLSTAVFAYNPLDTGLCKHHPVHTADCGYEQGRAGAACEHKHAKSCFETDCIHEHDENCGGMEDETACTHKCSMDSGCVTLVCSHKAGGHDDSCGYREEVKGKPCGFVCPVCSGAYDDSGVEITVPKKLSVDSATHKADLMEGVTATDEDGKDYQVSVYSVASKDKDYVWDEKELLNVKGSDTYSVVYVAQNNQGDIVAADDINVDKNDVEDVTDEPADTEQNGDETTGDTTTPGGDKTPEKPADSENTGDGAGEGTGSDTGDENTGGGGVPIITDSQLEYADDNIKVTVTLPDGVNMPDGYVLYAEKLTDGDYYPTEDAVKAEAAEINDYQCYKIRWKNKNNVSDEKTMNQILGDNPEKGATVKIEYLKNDASRLYGPAGGRKLLIYNSKDDGSLNTQVADTVENVTVAGNYYTSFTFTARDSGPYVFVCKYLEQGYIENISIASTEDGSEPFDNTGDLKDKKIDVPGNDSSKNNGVVRSYDTILYNLSASFAAREVTATKKEVNLYFELTIEKSTTAARFDTSKMLWLDNNYSVEYLDGDGKVIIVMSHDGKFYRPKANENGEVVYDSNGFAEYVAKPEYQVFLNGRVSGSTNGRESYKVTNGGVVKQRLVGCAKVSDKENILASTKDFTAAVEVRNADHGEVFTPTFKMWLEGNENNYGKETRIENSDKMLPAEVCTGNEITADKVTVSAGTNFNAQLKKNNDMSYKNWFDFSKGDVVDSKTREELTKLANLEKNHGKSNPAEFVDENGNELSNELKSQYANYRYGRITCYGIALQLYNDTDNKPDENRKSKGLKGLSLPVGDITFDLNFYSEALSNGSSVDDANKEYTAILWDYNENTPANQKHNYTYNDPGRGEFETPGDGKGNGGRKIYWDGEDRSAYAKGAAPSNYIAYHKGCYYGGDWKLVKGNNSSNKVDIKTVASPQLVKGTGAGTTYHFSVSDYDFDFDDHHFPTQDAGNSGDVTEYKDYARSFSAGCVQVLSVFPMVQKVSHADLFLNTKVSNLKVTTRAGQTLEQKEGDVTGYDHEVNKKDNTQRDQIVLYAPGNLTKGSAFNGKKANGSEPNSTNEGYLGTDYWTTAYDCSTFAGDNIWIISYGMMASGSDYRMKSMNLLQLFDSKALSVRDEPDVQWNFVEKYGDKKGTATFLYALDPKYLEGYDSNNKKIMEHMNQVREEDLVYTTTMPDSDGMIEVNGMTGKCIGVLMEIRNCDLRGGLYQYMRIPIKVNGDKPELVGKTVATVNTFRMWSYNLTNGNQPITWENGIWDDDKEQNTLENYKVPETGIDNDNHFCGQVVNGVNSSPPNYVKTEYQDGHQVQGTHNGGTLSGNSLLILSYKAHINIGVDNKNNPGTGGSITYDQSNGETVVDYRLSGITTNISDPTGQPDRPPTTLKIQVVLDEDNKTNKQRISISGDSYIMEGYEVGSDGKPVEEKTKKFHISSNSESPTELYYKATDGELYKLAVYAQPSTNNKEVTFVIEGAPVGLAVPDITFKANFAATTELKNNDVIKTSAYISGTGDNRAYNEAEGNTDNITVGIVLLGSTNLVKKVNAKYIELGGNITYDVLYTNSGSTKLGKIYFYDLLPKDGDVRDSAYEGKVFLRRFNVKTDDKNSGLKATVYYSTTEYQKLYNKVSVFGGSGTPEEKATNIENMLEGEEDKDFLKLGSLNNGNFEYEESLKRLSAEKLNELMSNITGLYVKVEDLPSNKTVTLEFTIETEGNQAADWYKNIANSWIAGTKTLPLTSNKVETSVVARDISGVVWYDQNYNGMRDKGEKLLKGVTCTLFKMVNGKYEPCRENVLKKDSSKPEDYKIEPIVTKENGEYSFGKLPAGEYAVAFSGEALKPYDGGATEYQVEGSGDYGNDGVSSNEFKGIDENIYPYVTKFSTAQQSIVLHTIDEIVSQNIALTNFNESITHQDLGVIKKRYILPKTGGMGTAPYIIGGLLLMLLASVLLYRSYTQQKREEK